MIKPYKICILGYMKLGEMARKVIETISFQDTIVEEKDCSFETLPQTVDQAMAEGCEVFIAGSANAAEFRNRSNGHLVEIRVDLADYLLSIKKAMAIGARSIAVAVYRYSNAPDIELLRRLSPCPVELIRYEDSAELYELLSASSCDTVIGASFSYEAAESLGKKGVLIYESEYTIRSSIEQARRLAAELRATAREREIMNAILRYSPAGILVTDEQGRITVINSAAKKLIASQGENLRGKPLENVVPEISSALFPKGQTRQERRLLMDGAMIRCTRTALCSGEEAIGSLYTLQADNTRRRRETCAEEPLRRPQGRWEDAICNSSTMKEFIAQALPLSALEHSLMICGEVGTGKRFVSQCIHNASPRAAHPYVLLNCSSVAPQEAARILFGSEDLGATRPGVLEQAGNGTLVLLDLARAPIPVCSCLLQALVERRFFRVGGSTSVPFLARVITLIESEERTDIPEALWQRLNIFTLTLPPLRERKEDILPLFRLFLLQENIQRFRGGSELQELLEFYSWPGNLVALSAVSKRYAQYLSRAVRSNAGTRRLMLQQAIGEEELLRDLCYKYPALNHIEDNPTELVLEGLAEAKRILRYNNTMLAERFRLSRTTLWRMQKRQVD